MREAMMKTMKAFDCRRRRELVLVGAAICAMGIVTSKSVWAADLDVGPGYPGGYYEHPYPYPPRVQGYPLYEGPPIYYPRPRYYHPYAWADPDNGYRYGQPRYLYSPYVDRPPAPVPFAGDPRAVPQPDDLLAEGSPGYGWQPPPGW
jgi:hypothetical protein